MVSVKSHSYESHGIFVVMAGYEPDQDNGLRLGDLTINPTVEGFFDGEALRLVDVLDVQAHFENANFKHEWLEDGQAAEAQGPFILDGQEFTLKGLLEYLYRRYTGQRPNKNG